MSTISLCANCEKNAAIYPSALCGECQTLETFEPHDPPKNEEMMPVCTNCHASLPDGALYCCYCQEELTKICSHCGEEHKITLETCPVKLASARAKFEKRHWRYRIDKRYMWIGVALYIGLVALMFYEIAIHPDEILLFSIYYFKVTAAIVLGIVSLIVSIFLGELKWKKQKVGLYIKEINGE